MAFMSVTDTRLPGQIIDAGYTAASQSIIHHHTNIIAAATKTAEHGEREGGIN
jgi:hypothetical protein